ncbi:MAG: hypothetical protein AAFV27_12025, partial [Pseudomonadota bacterium]
FNLRDGPFGDATEATFEFSEVRGDGEVRVRFFEDGDLIDRETYQIIDGQITADLDGASFDQVRIRALDDTAFALDGFAFDRMVEDEFLFG